MRFEKLTKSQLKILKSQGYTLLTSNQNLTDEKVYWFPERMADVMEYLLALDASGKIVPFKEQNLLVIDDAIENINEEDLIGEVFI
mgnify:CR=1 FL=1